MTFASRKLKFVARQVSRKVAFADAGRPYVGLENIEGWTGRRTEGEAGEPEGTVALFERGDVLFGKLRPYLAKVLVAEEAGCCSTEALVLRPDGLTPAFLRFVLLDERFIDEVNASTYGVKMPRAAWEDIGSVVVPTPPIEQQERIVAFLDLALDRVDRLISAQLRFIAGLAERLKTTIAHEIRGARVQDRTVSPLAPHLGSVPSSWNVVPLKHLVDPRRQVMYGIVLPGPDVDEGIPIVKGGDVKPGRLDPEKLSRTTPEIEAPYARARLRGGDLVISIRGGIGDIEEVPDSLANANLTQDAARIAPATCVHGPWLRYALRSPDVFGYLAARASGAAVRGINIFDLKRVPIPTPPIEEQVGIAERLDEVAARIERTIALAQRHVARLRGRRRAVISAAIRGRVGERLVVEAEAMETA